MQHVHCSRLHTPPAALPGSSVHRSKRQVVLQLAALALLPSLGARAQAPAPAQAPARPALASTINRTARFRALSQRVAKVYGQMYLQVLPGRSRDWLEHSRKQIKAGLRELNEQSWPAEVARLLASLRQAAQQLDALLDQPVSKDGYLAVIKQSEAMLDAADKATQALEQLSPVPTARLVNIAGRQRMLSQRLARNYGFVMSGLAGSGVREQMAQDAALFQTSLADLAKAPVSTSAIRGTLELGQAQWIFLETALKRPPEARALEDVAKASERMLEVMDELTAQYEAALQEILG